MSHARTALSHTRKLTLQAAGACHEEGKHGLGADDFEEDDAEAHGDTGLAREECGGTEKAVEGAVGRGHEAHGAQRVRKEAADAAADEERRREGSRGDRQAARPGGGAVVVHQERGDAARAVVREVHRPECTDALACRRFGAVS